jgi:hypothetical protein
MEKAPWVDQVTNVINDLKLNVTVAHSCFRRSLLTLNSKAIFNRTGFVTRDAAWRQTRYRLCVRQSFQTRDSKPGKLCGWKGTCFKILPQTCFNKLWTQPLCRFSVLLRCLVPVSCQHCLTQLTATVHFSFYSVPLNVQPTMVTRSATDRQPGNQSHHRTVVAC